MRIGQQKNGMGRRRRREWRRARRSLSAQGAPGKRRRLWRKRVRGLVHRMLRGALAHQVGGKDGGFASKLGAGRVLGKVDADAAGKLLLERGHAPLGRLLLVVAVHGGSPEPALLASQGKEGSQPGAGRARRCIGPDKGSLRHALQELGRLGLVAQHALEEIGAGGGGSARWWLLGMKGGKTNQDSKGACVAVALPGRCGTGWGWLLCWG